MLKKLIFFSAGPKPTKTSKHESLKYSKIFNLDKKQVTTETDFLRLVASSMGVTIALNAQNTSWFYKENIFQKKTSMKNNLKKLAKNRSHQFSEV